MKYLLIAFFIFNLLASAVAGQDKCQTIINQQGVNTVEYVCTDLTNLFELEKAKSNTTSIEITDSRIAHIPGHAFARFGATLITLDLHGCGIGTIDSYAFIGLTKLKNLILWDNRLRFVAGDWFVNTYNLKTLDLSFNYIEVIDYRIFQLLPNLENFYFDYNRIKTIEYSMFAYLTNLKNVKFEKNPLNWGFRALLMWQLENQRVKYNEEWEDWGWMNAVIKDCSESGQGEIPKDTILDCAVGKLLDFTQQIFSTTMREQNLDCTMKARQLVRCMRPKNATGNTDNETVRRILEDYETVLKPMSRSLARFSPPTK
ncbi:uncharacterized protein LOC117600391 [Osmia lignaria lignaria]|uniref:uncharacterized protein LOC117600391 n=1 Tax=Osmia lignaria lignaria TaxID=1437193 RepID=UPI001478BBA0|nr:protein toll-like [Osmia lignaria]